MIPVLFSCLCLAGVGILTLFIRDKQKGWVVSVGTLICALAALPSVIKVLLGGHTHSAILELLPPAGTVRLVMDPLAAFFLLPVLVGGFLTSVYSIGYMRPYAEQGKSLSTYYFFLPVMIASMTLVLLVRNSLVFLIAWELMSVSSFFLVVFEQEKEEVRKAGYNYLIAMQVGASLLIAAFSLAAMKSGSPDMDNIADVFKHHGASATVLFLLFFFGFGTKAGFIPVHTWLPQAHPAAPTPVSAIMSGVMIKTGIYGIVRVMMYYGTPKLSLALFVFLIAAATSFFGIINAIAQKDFKRLLAYSSSENIGIIGMGLGIGMIGLALHRPISAMLGFSGGLLHVWNHFIFKSALFFGAGAVTHRTHTRNMETLGGLVWDMPVTTVLFLIASLGISGLPLFNGFISELLIYLGFFNQLRIPDTWAVVSAILGMGGLALIGILSVLCFSKVFSVIFLGHPRSVQHDRPKDPPRIMLFSMFLLTGLVLAIGFFPKVILPFLKPVISELSGRSAADFPISVPILFGTLSEIFGLFLILFVALLLFRRLLLLRQPVRFARTWDCASRMPDSRLQYTGSSFSSPFSELVQWAAPIQTDQEKPAGLFPDHATYQSRSNDRIESIWVRYIIRTLTFILKPFTSIQTGKTRQYLLYGLVFLVLILVWIIGMGQ